MRVMIEAVGSPTWGTLLPSLREVASYVVGLDVDPLSHGLYACDKGYIVPRYSEPGCFERLIQIALAEHIDWVIPSVNEGLLGWAERKVALAQRGIHVIISDPEIIAACTDKWLTYQLFRDNDIPTPRTSLDHEFRLIKPRQGRGAEGIYESQPGTVEDMHGLVSQEIVKGQEHSIDVLCDRRGRAVAMACRKRLAVESGLSVKGQVVRDRWIEDHVARILDAGRFFGPVNIQCFTDGQGGSFIEINPRIAGGLSLSMAATANWFILLPRLLMGDRVESIPTIEGLTMMRHYSDTFVRAEDLLA